MTLDEVLKKVKEHKKGQFFWIDIETDHTGDMNAEARKAGHTCTKFSHLQVRRGVDYENIGAVKEKRAAGVPKGTTWGTYSTDPEHEGMVIYHNGKVYIKFEPVIMPDTAINAKQVKYFVDGVEMTLDDAIDTGYFTNSGIKSISNPSPLTNRVKLENIINIY